MLDCLGGRLAAGWLDRRLQCLEHLGLLLDQRIHRLGRVGVELELGDDRRGLAADGRDLLGQPRGVLELGQGERAKLVGVGLELQPDHGAGGERVLEHGPVLEVQGLVECRELLLDVHALFGRGQPTPRQQGPKLARLGDLHGPDRGGYAPKPAAMAAPRRRSAAPRPRPSNSSSPYQAP